jgi:hypothetical protein
MKTRWYRRIYRASLLVLVMTFASQPVLVAAAPYQSPLADIEQQLLDAGDVFITSIGQAFLTGLQVVPAAEAIFVAPIESVSVQSIQQTRARLLDLAFESATALGASGALARTIEKLGPNRPSSTDPNDIVGIPESMRADIELHAGYSNAQIDILDSELHGLLAEQQAVSSSGLPADIVSQLQQAGFSDSEIQSLETAAAEHGLAPSGFDSQLEQFSAARDELADGRTAALVGYVQMVLREAFARQAGGERPRAVTEDELETLAQDQLRLLIHAGQLQALWGEDPSLEVGEGHWWFIERYANRAAERAETIILETQNPALLVDLFLSLHMSTLAVTARAGGSEYVKPELDGLTDLLAELSGGHDFLAQTRDATQGVAKVAVQLSAKALWREMITWPVRPEQLERTSHELRVRLSTPPQVEGSFAELNEDNNSLGIPVASSLSAYGTLHPSLINQIIASIRDHVPQNVLDFLWGVLSGQTDSWLQMVLNLGLSFVPVLGAIPDIISLIVDPSPFVKAVSVLGIIFSLGDILAFLGIGVPVAIGSFVGDAASAALKFVFKNADEAIQIALDGLKFGEAFNVVKKLGRFISEEIIGRFGGFGDEAFEARRFFDDVIQGASGLWADFSAYVRRVGTEGLRSGITRGSMLAGKVDRLVADLSKPAFEAIVRIGDDLAEAGLKLSDEAAQGLGAISKKLSGESTERFVSALRRNPEIADDLINDTLEAIGRAGGNANWTDEALDGVENLVAKSGGVGPNKVENILRRIDDPVLAGETFRVLGRMSVNWSDEAIEGVAIAINRTGGNADKLLRALNSTEDVLSPLRGEVGDRLFRLIREAEHAAIGASDEWPGFVNKMFSIGAETGTPAGNLFGNSFVLFHIDDQIGFAKIDGFEIAIPRNGQTRVYDVITTDGFRLELKNIATWERSYSGELYRDLVIHGRDQIDRLSWRLQGTPGVNTIAESDIIRRTTSYILDQPILQETKDELIKLLNDWISNGGIQFTNGARPWP